jgi:hypothetical protein
MADTFGTESACVGMGSTCGGQEVKKSRRLSLASAIPKRNKKAKNTIINDNERHIIYHNINKAETTIEANKCAKPNYGPRTGVLEQNNPHKHTEHWNERVTIKDWRASAKSARM